MIDLQTIGFEQDDALDACIAFGERLITTGDLDPVYIAVAGAQIPEPQLCRLLLTYFCYYHLGASAWLSEHEGPDYWQWMSHAAENQTPSPLGSRWPRATERRHFRGQKCVEAINWLSVISAEERVRDLARIDNADDLIAAVVRWPMFGPWIAFKIADVMERVYGARVSFSPSIPMMYESPRAALGRLPPGAYEHMLQHFSGFKAPPRYDRPCGSQETETVCCKWLSSLGGHYSIGKDIREIRHGLAGWGPLAERLERCLPENVA